MKTGIHDVNFTAVNPYYYTVCAQGINIIRFLSGQRMRTFSENSEKKISHFFGNFFPKIPGNFPRNYAELSPGKFEGICDFPVCKPAYGGCTFGKFLQEIPGNSGKIFPKFPKKFPTFFSEKKVSHKKFSGNLTQFTTKFM